MTTQPTIDTLIPIGFRVSLSIPTQKLSTTYGFDTPERENAGAPAMAQIVTLGRKTWWQKFLMFIGIKPRYKIGTWVYFKKYTYDELKISTPDADISLFLLDEDQIIAVVNQ